MGYPGPGQKHVVGESHISRFPRRIHAIHHLMQPHPSAPDAPWSRSGLEFPLLVRHGFGRGRPGVGGRDDGEDACDDGSGTVREPFHRIWCWLLSKWRLTFE